TTGPLAEVVLVLLLLSLPLPLAMTNATTRAAISTTSGIARFIHYLLRSGLETERRSGRRAGRQRASKPRAAGGDPFRRADARWKLCQRGRAYAGAPARR